jgi:hypothetical protein
VDDKQKIYLSWLAVSCMEAELGRWNAKKKKKQLTNDNVKLFFDGNTFSHGKDIGSTLLAAVQYICSAPVTTQRQLS